MPKQVWIIAGVLSALLVMLFLGLSSWQRGQELARLKADLTTAQATTDQNTAAMDELKDKLADSQARIAELEKEKGLAAQMHKTLEEDMRTALESKDVTISKLQGRLTVNILDRVLFDSGEATLKSDGEVVLRKVAGFLIQHPALKVQVVGHTDNVPIRPAARNRFPSNWELSTARATAAVRFLTEKAGVDPRRVGAVGYGEFRPVADNTTVEGRARNRRIAITVLSDELAGADQPANGDAKAAEAQPLSATATNSASGPSASLQPADTNAPTRK